MLYWKLLQSGILEFMIVSFFTIEKLIIPESFQSSEMKVVDDLHMGCRFLYNLICKFLCGKRASLERRNESVMFNAENKNPESEKVQGFVFDKGYSVSIKNAKRQQNIFHYLFNLMNEGIPRIPSLSGHRCGYTW
jgi:hypothetical protein